MNLIKIRFFYQFKTGFLRYIAICALPSSNLPYGNNKISRNLKRPEILSTFMGQSEKMLERKGYPVLSIIAPTCICIPIGIV